MFTVFACMKEAGRRDTLRLTVLLAATFEGFAQAVLASSQNRSSAREGLKVRHTLEASPVMNWVMHGW